MQRTLNIPDSFNYTSRGVTVAMDATQLTDDILVNMVLAWQGVADAASGAVKDAATGTMGVEAEDYAAWVKSAAGLAWLATDAAKKDIAESTLNLMISKVRAVESGQWTTKGTGGASRDDRTAAIVNVIGALITDKGKRKEYAAMKWTDRVAAATKNFDKNAAKLEAKVTAEIDRLVAARDALAVRKAEMAELAIDIDI